MIPVEFKDKAEQGLRKKDKRISSGERNDNREVLYCRKYF